MDCVQTWESEQHRLVLCRLTDALDYESSCGEVWMYQAEPVTDLTPLHNNLHACAGRCSSRAAAAHARSGSTPQGLRLDPKLQTKVWR